VAAIATDLRLGKQPRFSNQWQALHKLFDNKQFSLYLTPQRR